MICIFCPMPYAELMMRIEDVIVKTILCGESSISEACRIFQNHRGNCFGKQFDQLFHEYCTKAPLL